MAHVSEVQIRRQSPHARRRRRLAQQQSACCGCFLAVACVVFGILAAKGPLARWREHRAKATQTRVETVNYFPLDISLDRYSYARYSLVRIVLKLVDPLGRAVVVDAPPPIIVKHQGKPVETVGGLDRVVPQYDPKTHLYVAHWPVPWNAAPGRYIVETRYDIPNPELWPWMTREQEEEKQRQKRPSKKDEKKAPVKAKIQGPTFCEARTAFDLIERTPPAMPPGMCAATWEPSFPRGELRKPSGEKGDWRVMFDWCDFIGADTLWMRGAVTQAAVAAMTMEQPFVQADLAALPTVAAEAHRRGIKFGTWAMAYNTLPEKSNARKPPYLFAKNISRSSGKIVDTSFVSLLDQRRLEQLAGFFRAMQADPNVDFVGLDYMRTEPGYELTDRFAQEMPVDLPPDWARMDRAARWRFVAQRTERPGFMIHPEFYEAWNWYRASLGAQTVANIITRSQIKKPVWIFALSWKHGVQHGQDALMFTDAGVSILAQMLYQTNEMLFDVMLKDWPNYIRRGQANLLGGDQVDDYWHQKLGPEEMYRRMVAAHERFVRGGHMQGAFWHDISRAAVRGNLGPYPGSEWGLAGGAAFSKVRETWRVYPLTATLTAPAEAPVNASFQMQLKLRNICKETVRRVRVKPMATVGVALDNPGPVEVPELGAGQTLTMPFAAHLVTRNEARRNRFMAAFRITWPVEKYGGSVREDLPRVIIVMSYVEAK